MNTEEKKNSLRELLDTLEAQIQQQDRIILLQEETIKILNDQNDQLMATLSRIIHS